MWERTAHLLHLTVRKAYLEKDVCAHGLPVRDDGLLVFSLPVPAVEFNASRSQRGHSEGPFPLRRWLAGNSPKEEPILIH